MSTFKAVKPMTAKQIATAINTSASSKNVFIGLSLEKVCHNTLHQYSQFWLRELHIRVRYLIVVKPLLWATNL